jgi:hypothetical protein
MSVVAIHYRYPTFSELSLEQAVQAIHEKFEVARRAERRAYATRIVVGQMLIALRKRIEAGEAGEGVNWWKWYQDNFARTRRDAERVMALARADDPEAAHEAAKAETREAVQKHRATYVSRNAQSSKPTSPPKTDPIGSSPVRYSEGPATSVPPKSQHGSVSARDIALEDFSAWAMELVRLTKKNNAERFANTSMSFKDLRELGHFFLNLALVCEKKCEAEDNAKRAIEVAAILGEAADDAIPEAADHPVLSPTDGAMAHMERG